MKRIAVVLLLLSAVTAKAEIVNQYVEITGLRGTDSSGGDDLEISGGLIGGSFTPGDSVAIRPYGQWATTDINGYHFSAQAFGADLAALIKPADKFQAELIVGVAKVTAEIAALNLKDDYTGTRGGLALRYLALDAVELHVRGLAYDYPDSSSNEFLVGIGVRVAEPLWLVLAGSESDDYREVTATLRFRM